MPRALLVRHCESAGQAPDAPLTTRGSEQALALAAFLEAHAPDQLASSPYLRARATIEPFALRSGLAVEIHAGLAERRLAPEPIDHWREVVERSFRDPHLRVAGGESGAEAFARGWHVFQAILQKGHRLPVVVSHGQLLSLVLHSIDPSFGYAGWESLSNPDVYLLEGDAHRAFRFKRVWA